MGTFHLEAFYFVSTKDFCEIHSAIQTIQTINMGEGCSCQLLKEP